MPQFFKIFFVGFDTFFQIITMNRDPDMAHSVRRHIRFRTHIADSLNRVHDTLHLLLFFRETKSFISCRPGSSRQSFTGVGQMLPEVFRNKRHKRMQERHDSRQYIHKDILGNLPVGIVRSIKTALRRFNIPVAERVPCKIINRIRGSA